MSARSLGSVGVGLLLFTIGLASQAQPTPQGAPTPGPPPPTVPRTPPRDASAPEATGTARIRGRVIAAETGNPLQRAQVRVMSPDLRQPRTAVTDADGRYEIDNLPRGRYSVNVGKPGFVDLQFGQRRAFEPGRPLDLQNGQIAERIHFALPRGGVITGRVTDERGEPAPAVRVQAMRYMYLPSGNRQLVPSGTGGPSGPFMTDDLGQFRIYGLLPGAYLVTGGALPGLGDFGNPGLGTTYYPGTSSPDQAETVSVELGHEVTAHFSLVPTRVAKISGVVLNSQGQPVPRRMLMLAARSEGGGWTRTVGPTAPDGAFSIPNLPPGEYSIDVAPPGIPAGQDFELASVPITISGDDLSGLVITTRAGSVVTGRVVFEGTAPRPTEPLRIMPTAAEQSAFSRVYAGGSDNGLVDASGRFRIAGVNGRVLFRPSFFGPGQRWFLKSVAVARVDVTDVGYDVSNDVDQVEVVLTDRQAAIAGTVKNSRGQFVEDYIVAIFPSERSEGVNRGRFIRTARPDQQGRYETKGLPPARYFAVAVEALEQGAQYDPAFQEQVRPKARTFVLNEGETLSLDLQLLNSPNVQVHTVIHHRRCRRTARFPCGGAGARRIARSGALRAIPTSFRPAGVADAWVPRRATTLPRRRARGKSPGASFPPKRAARFDAPRFA